MAFIHLFIYRRTHLDSKGQFQHKPCFGVKIVLSGFTKDAQWSVNAEKAWTQLFLLTEYAFVLVSLSDATFMGGEYSN